jgi:hypothetical protein
MTPAYSSNRRVKKRTNDDGVKRSHKYATEVGVATKLSRMWYRTLAVAQGDGKVSPGPVPTTW